MLCHFIEVIHEERNDRLFVFCEIWIIFVKLAYLVLQLVVCCFWFRGTKFLNLIFVVFIWIYYFVIWVFYIHDMYILQMRKSDFCAGTMFCFSLKGGIKWKKYTLGERMAWTDYHVDILSTTYYLSSFQLSNLFGDCSIFSLRCFPKDFVNHGADGDKRRLSLRTSSQKFCLIQIYLPRPCYVSCPLYASMLPRNFPI